MTQEQKKDIEQRRIERYGNRPIEPYCRDTEFEEAWYDIGRHNGYEDGAFDQDLISREDERKRVIEKACKVFCNMCRNHYRLLHGYDCTQLNNGNCAIYKQFKHAMEE